jgi:hypothetical protein
MRLIGTGKKYDLTMMLQGARRYSSNKDWAVLSVAKESLRI